MKPGVHVALRRFQESDRALVRNSWYRSFTAAHPELLRQIRRDVYDKGFNALIDRLLEEHPPTIAYFPAVPDETVAWVCRGVDVAFYVYVKHPYRRTGIGSFLVSGAREHAFQTPAGDILSREVESLYNPFSLT